MKTEKEPVGQTDKRGERERERETDRDRDRDRDGERIQCILSKLYFSWRYFVLSHFKTTLKLFLMKDFIDIWFEWEHNYRYMLQTFLSCVFETTKTPTFSEKYTLPLPLGLRILPLFEESETDLDVVD